MGECSLPAAGGLFSRGVPKLKPAGGDGVFRLFWVSIMVVVSMKMVDMRLNVGADGSCGRSPSSRAAAPRPPSHHHDGSSTPQGPSLASSSSSLPSTNMKHSCSAPPPPPPVSRRANAPSPPSATYNREKPTSLSPNHTPPLPTKPPSSPVNSRCPSSSGGKPASSPSLAPPPPQHFVSNGSTGSGEVAPELPQRQNSLSTKRPAPSPGGSTRGPAPSPGGSTRGPAPPSPASPVPQHGANRLPPPVRETPCRGAGELLAAFVFGCFMNHGPWFCWYLSGLP